MVERIQSNQAYFEDFVTRNIDHSNRIEGSTLSRAETYAIVFNDNSFKITAAPREIYEAINLKYALSYLLEHLTEPLSQNFIKHIGILINKNINEIDGYRRVPVFIRGAEHIPPAPELVPHRMMELLYHYEHTDFHSPYERAAQMHMEFERLHPLPDGNGRTGRVLINSEVLRGGPPPVVLPSERRAEYFSLLAAYDVPAMADFFQELSDMEGARLRQFESGYTQEEQAEEEWER